VHQLNKETHFLTQLTSGIEIDAGQGVITFRLPWEIDSSESARCEIGETTGECLIFTFLITLSGVHIGVFV